LPKTPVQNIALIGFMAVGKSAIGRNLARKLRRRFVDLDRLLEKAEELKVAEIFSQKGEAYFRQLEKRTLAAVLQADGQVVATGGGVVMDDDNLNLLREKSLLICLSASVDALLARAGNDAKRPLLKGANRRARIEGLLRQREARYAQAHMTIDTSDSTIDEVVEKILCELGSNK
jgi:shikimate kinase